MSGMGIYGLSGSGIDVDSMVKMGMMTKQNEYDKMYKKEVKNEWEKEAYTNVYSDLNTFNSVTLSKYKMSSTTNPQNVSSTNSSVFTAVANADAAQMNHTVDVSSMASNAYMLTGDNGITRIPSEVGGKPNKSIYLADIVGPMEAEDKIEMVVGDGDTKKKLTLTYDQVVTSKQTLNDLASAFKNLGLNITSSYDATNDAFSLYNKDSGKKNTISIGATTNSAVTLMKNLNLKQVKMGNDADSGETTSTMAPLTFEKVTVNDELEVTSGNATEATGTDATVTIDGREYTSESNKISVSNVTYTLMGTGKATASVSQDTDKIIENVKQFVEDYNKILDMLNEKYYEEKYSDYGVLTQSQEKGMTKEQIEKWNEKAKSGILNHSNTIGKIIADMREAIYTPVESVDSNYNTMMSIGVTSSNDRGHLRLDEEKLKKALAADPDAVYQLFSSSGDVTKTNKNGTTTTVTDYGREGVMNRISDKMFAGLKEIKSYAGDSSEVDDSSTLGNLIRDLKTKMSNFKTMMSAYESLLYKRYDAMETAIQRLTYTSGYITGQ